MTSLMIKDLSLDKELSRKEMTAVSGGSVFQNNGVNAIANGGGFSFASPNVITAPVTQVDASTKTYVDLTNVSNTINNLGGQVLAKQF
ncbi:hypothetical protein P3T23_000830 [Paraburkholderia sp. GAS448]|jgi:hypothetical protein|uniref:hypothetical protein n=1 Tax=Paraburkholderia sp. GAS448 TaxID=3035136 RepID=UPI003D1E9FD3